MNIYEGQKRKQKKTQTTQICANKSKSLKGCSVAVLGHDCMDAVEASPLTGEGTIAGM